MRSTIMILAVTTALGLAGCSADEPATDDTGGDAVSTVTAQGTDEVTWESGDLSVATGTVDVTVVCGPNVPHGIGIEGVQGGEELAACAGGGASTATVELEAGTYTFFCTVPGHRDAGMEGTLTVG